MLRCSLAGINFFTVFEKPARRVKKCPRDTLISYSALIDLYASQCWLPFCTSITCVRHFHCAVKINFFTLLELMSIRIPREKLKKLLIDAAIHSVEKGAKSERNTAEQYGVNRQTLRNRGQNLHPKHVGRPKNFSQKN